MEESAEGKNSNITLISRGDLFKSGAQTIVNPINCRGAMGKGLALEFKRRYPAMYADYVRRCKAKESNQNVKIGEPYLWKESETVWILNFPTKEDWRQQSNLAFVRDGLAYLAAHVKDWEITSLAVPALGCGLGELMWEDVRTLIIDHLEPLDIPVYVYAPQGAPKLSKRRQDFDRTCAPTEFIFQYGSKKVKNESDSSALCNTASSLVCSEKILLKK